MSGCANCLIRESDMPLQLWLGWVWQTMRERLGIRHMLALVSRETASLPVQRSVPSEGIWQVVYLAENVCNFANTFRLPIRSIVLCGEASVKVP